MRLHRVVVVSLVSCVVASSTRSQEPSEQFRRWDKNNDGKLTRDELPEGLRPLFDRVDTNGDGAVSPQEDRQFVASLATARSPGPQPPLRIPDNVRAEVDVPYAATDNPRQRLDVYLPKAVENDKPLPVVTFIHGGGWQGGDKRQGASVVMSFVESKQYAAISIGYRLTGEAIWPAQIHDCKAAIRWLRAHAKQYNLDPDRIGIVGPSAGGHLVAMLGTSGDVAALEGTLGEHSAMSSRVTCVVDQFGPVNLLTMGGWHDEPSSPEARLIGGPLQDNKEKARAASPIHYVSKDDPPFMMIHGTSDPIVPFGQSEELLAALEKVGVDAMLVPVEGGGHGNFSTLEVPTRMRQFFDKHLLGRDVPVSAEPIKLRPNP